MTALFVEPTKQVFAQKDEQTFETQLKSTFESTDCLPVDAKAALQLDTKGVTKLGVRLTRPAFSQICAALSPGLSTVVRTLLKQHVDAKPTKATAIAIYNQVLERCSDSLDGYKLVIDRRSNVADGFVGRRYRLFANYELYHQIRNAFPSLKWAEGIMSGRRCAMRFTDKDVLFSLEAIPDIRATTEPFFGGVHFSNSETGECSLAAAALIIRQWCDNKAIGRFKEGGGTITHREGPQFDKKLLKLFEGVQLKFDEATKYKANVLSMIGQLLGLGVTKDQHAERNKELTKQLCLHKLSQGFVKKVLDDVVVRGSYRADRIHGMLDPMKLAAKRTVYDLFNAITDLARHCDLREQERLEHFGYRMLTSDFWKKFAPSSTPSN